MTRRTILFVAANPSGTGRLALDQEARAIQAELERSGHGCPFELVTRWAAQPLDLLHELRKLKPTVLHFAGHGASGEPAGPRPDGPPRRDVASTADATVNLPHEGLYFQGPDGRPQLVSTEALQTTLGAAGSSVQLVVLNACYSDVQADALLAHVDCVLGMRGTIEDSAARSFAIGLYGGLGERESVATAYRQACAAIQLEGLADADRPQLKVHPGADADRLVLGSPAGRPRWLIGVVAVGAVAVVASGGAALALRAPIPPRPLDPRSPPEMVAFREVTFDMGSTPEDIHDGYLQCSVPKCPPEQFLREAPVRRVTLSPFAIDRTEVTNAAFAHWLTSAAAVVVDRLHVRTAGADLVDLQRSELRTAGATLEPLPGTEHHPVAGVSAAAARAYCAAQGKHLPTEAQWEYAARGTTRRRFPWGDKVDTGQAPCRLSIGRPQDHGRPMPCPVADVASTSDVTPEGVFDLGGNVSEWVADRFTDAYPDCGACRDPEVTNGPMQVIRGGNHVFDASAARGAARSHGLAPASHTGFRCAR